jgi:hypothetical protein
MQIMKKTILLIVLVLVASVALMAASSGFEALARLTVWNRTGKDVNIQLTTAKNDGNLHYYLTAKPGLTVFTVERKIYDATYWSCGASVDVKIDVLTALSLTFTDCTYLHNWRFSADKFLEAYGDLDGWSSGRQWGDVVYPYFKNFGEPGMEKVHNPITRWFGWLGDYKSSRSPYPYDIAYAYWGPWRVSYTGWTTRDVHWLFK